MLTASVVLPTPPLTLPTVRNHRCACSTNRETIASVAVLDRYTNAISRADPLLPKREGRALLGDVGYAVEGPDVGPHHQPRRPQQNQIPGRIRQVHGIPAVAVPADEEPMILTFLATGCIYRLEIG